MKTAIALGTFDGVHIAHRAVLDFPKDYKKTAVTFLKPPKMFFEGKDELLMSYEDKEKALKNMGFSEIIPLDFNAVKDISPCEFLELLVEKYNPKIISCGFNYRFGKNGAGDTRLLEKFCADKGISLRLCEPIMQNGETVSSTLIRNMLKNGEVEKASALMPVPFSFSCEVIKGDRRGRTIGFPTINQKYPENLVKIKFGVYKTRVSINGKYYDGITNIGVRPTYHSDYIISETYIKDFSGELYGESVRIIPQKFLRKEIKFANVEELRRQIEIDLTK